MMPDRSLPTLTYTSPSTPRITWDRLRSIVWVIAWVASAGAVASATLMLWEGRLPPPRGLLSLLGLLIGLTSAGLWLASGVIEVVVVRWAGRSARPHAAALLILTPVLLATIWGLLAAGLPCRWMFRANKPAMDRWAQSFLAAPSPAPFQARIGSYDAFAIEPIPGGVKFLVRGAGFFRAHGGFAYSPSGPPTPDTADNEIYTPIGGAWYTRRCGED